MFVEVILLFVIGGVSATLPNGCTPLEEHVFDMTDPASIFGTNSELSQKSTPQRVGNLRSKRALPTGHFITNEIKTKDPVPIRLIPYEAILTNDGITYDAYTMDRWTDPERTDTMPQQSATAKGQSWNALLDLGTNLKQMVAGPDGNKGGVFTGKSGVQVGIEGSGEPVLTDWGDLYANFDYHGNGGTMEVPIVRGAALLTHIFTNANPIIKPMCLSNFNGQAVTFSCPTERSEMDGGSGHVSGTCNNGILHLVLDNTKKIKDITKIQYAVNSKSNWQAGQHSMQSCNAQKCRLTNDGKRVEIDFPNSHGTMSMAINYIGHYVVPGDWGNHPVDVTCTGGGKRALPSEIGMTASCDGSNNMHIRVDIGSFVLQDVNQIQYAVESADTWTVIPAMRICSADHCQNNGHYVNINLQAPAKNVRLAINVIGLTTLPCSYWFEKAYSLTCGGASISADHCGTQVEHGPGNVQTPSATAIPTTTTQRPVYTDPPVDTLEPFITLPPVDTQEPLITLPPVDTPEPLNTQEPTYTASPQQGTTHVSSGTKFVMELNEPGNELPNQTRKFMVYFSSPVTPQINSQDNSITFKPKNGGTYNGLMQLAYLGAGPRGDKSHNNDLDRNLGVYSYKPKASYCVLRDKAFVSFDWNPNNQHAANTMGPLLMITLPHHEYALRNTAATHLRDTIYGFKGYEGPSWLIEMEAPRASMEPDMAAVQQLTTQSKQEILDAINRDASEVYLDNICAHSDSYNVGKAFGMAARLASISRAFGTNHYHSIDNSIKNCLEKWLRIQDTLEDKWKFHYDTVWGGMFLRSIDGDLPYYADYGYPYYNDHHFHLGYFLYALAYYVKHDRRWGTHHKARIYAIARDVGNPSYKDKYFPVVRQKDIFMGFSWATGLVPGTRQEESSSEALNCYHGLAALGQAFGDEIMMRTGQVMLAMEIASVREYWHVRDHNFNHFPPMLQKYGVVGQIAEDDFYVYTLDWPCDPNKFPMRHGCLVGIQIIPITAVSKYWMDKDWAKHILQTCTDAIHPEQASGYQLTDPSEMRQLHSGWKAFCYAAMAPYDDAHATAAANYVKQQSPRTLVGGTGAASTLLFIYART